MADPFWLAQPLARDMFVRKPGEIGSPRHSVNFRQLVTETTPVTPPPTKTLAMQTQYNLQEDLQTYILDTCK